MKGKFIVFEGIDGSGKGTQISLASKFLFDCNKEYDLYITREPTRDRKEIREKMSQSGDVYHDAEWYANMFVEDRRNHVNRYIQPALDNGTHVICDRYKHSTFAYQQLQGMDTDKLVKMHDGVLVPDLIIVLDCAAEIAFERRKKDGATDVFDKNFSFQKQLRTNYLKVVDMLSSMGENIVVVNAEKEPTEVFAQIEPHISKLLSSK